MTLAIQHRIRTRPHGPRRRPTVCVLIPLYNYARYLESCVTSVLSQEHVDLNVIVIDDCSSDDSLAVAQALASADSRVQVRAHARNRGHIPTVNEGVAAADGDYLVKLDADDMLTPGSLARSTALLEDFPSVGFAYGVPWVIGDGPPPEIQIHTRNWTIWPGHEWLRKRIQFGTNCIKQPEAIMRLSALREVGPYDEKLPHTSDFEMWMRISTRWDVGRLNGAYQGFYRDHPDSMSHTVNGGLSKDVAQRLRAIDRLLTECSADLPDPNGMADTAHRALAREALSHAIDAYSRGVADLEPVDDFRKLALSAWPAAESFLDWRMVTHLAGLDPMPASWRAALAGRASLRDLKYRLLWRRWMWNGL